MKVSLSTDGLTDYVRLQVNTFYPDKELDAATIRPIVEDALERIDVCLVDVGCKNYTKNGEVTFSHLHTDQYATFLYFMSNSAFRLGLGPDVASKFYALNKALHCVEINYEAELPEKFLLAHPVAVVLGRAKYGNYFTVYQSCTVGSNLDGVSPSIGDGVAIFGGSRIIGNSHIGNNSLIATGTTIIDSDVPENSVAFMEGGRLTTKPRRRKVIKSFFCRSA